MSDNSNNTKGNWDSFLTHEDEASPDNEYIVPNIEFKLPKEKRQECRDIVLEIRKFGVSQRQTLYNLSFSSRVRRPKSNAGIGQANW